MAKKPILYSTVKDKTKVKKKPKKSEKRWNKELRQIEHKKKKSKK